MPSVILIGTRRVAGCVSEKTRNSSSANARPISATPSKSSNTFWKHSNRLYSLFVCKREARASPSYIANRTGTMVFAKASASGAAKSSKTSLKPRVLRLEIRIRTAVPGALSDRSSTKSSGAPPCRKCRRPEWVSNRSNTFEVKKMPSPIWRSGSVVSFPSQARESIHAGRKGSAPSVSSGIFHPPCRQPIQWCTAHFDTGRRQRFPNMTHYCLAADTKLIGDARGLTCGSLIDTLKDSCFK